MPVDIPQLGASIRRIRQAIEGWAPKDFVADVIALLDTAGAVVEATTIQWCLKHRQRADPTEFEPGLVCPEGEWDDTEWNCVIKPMLLVDPGSQP